MATHLACGRSIAQTATLMGLTCSCRAVPHHPQHRPAQLQESCRKAQLQTPMPAQAGRARRFWRETLQAPMPAQLLLQETTQSRGQLWVPQQQGSTGWMQAGPPGTKSWEPARLMLLRLFGACAIPWRTSGLLCPTLSRCAPMTLCARLIRQRERAHWPLARCCSPVVAALLLKVVACWL